jgi:hypothetical protein
MPGKTWIKGGTLTGGHTSLKKIGIMTMVKRKTEIKLDHTATSIKRFCATVLGTKNCGSKSVTESHTAALGTIGVAVKGMCLKSDVTRRF